MEYQENSYIRNRDLYFPGILMEVKKSRKALQPIFEAFTNALEAIKIKATDKKGFIGKVKIEIFATENLTESREFHSLTISDNGIGFNDEEFKRFNIYRDFSKGYKNLGSGRIQFVHYFDTTIYKSVFEKEGEFYEREFMVSKKEPFLKQNALVFYKSLTRTDLKSSGTRVTFLRLLENNNLYNSLDEVTFKRELIERYIHYFCTNRTTLPDIEIQYHVQGKMSGSTTILQSDIPDFDKTEVIKLPYSRISSDGKSIEKTEHVEQFNISAFKVTQDVLKENDLKLVSKGELVEDSGIDLLGMASGDVISGNRFLFLVSSDYIDARDSNQRGELSIPDQESFVRNTSLFTTEEILLNDIETGINFEIDKMYPEIKAKKEAHNRDLDRLKEMFMLDEETGGDIKISYNDSESRILEKFYEAEARKEAKIDARIKESIDKLEELDTTHGDYEDKLQEEAEKLVKSIPQQNKNTLTRYVARRKLVLELFEKILKKELSVQKKGSRDKAEALLHNLFFRQGTNNPEKSDLWIISEEFVFFNGTSESRLCDVEVNEKKIFKENFSEEENKYLHALGENRKIKKPDVLLFPDEGKCIILEFKNPEVNVSEHLNQINFYASLIRNHTIKEVQITTFFGYLIGERIEARDVRYSDSSFIPSYQFGYLYRPPKPIVGEDGRSDGSIYTEVIKYSTLLARAVQRNQIFIDKVVS